MKYPLSILIFVLIISCSEKKAQLSPSNVFTFDHYAINVADLTRSVEFYQKYLYVEEIYDGTEKDNIRWFSLGNNQELHIIAVDSLDIKIPKGVHMAVTTSDLEGYITFLKANMTDYYDWPGERGKISTRPDKVRQIYIQDPDGYWIEINDGIKRFDEK